MQLLDMKNLVATYQFDKQRNKCFNKINKF